MATNVRSSLVYMRLSTTSVADALDVTGKILICEVDSGWDTTADVTSVPTKNCGTFQIAQTAAHTLNGNGVVGVNLASNQISAQQLKQWADGNTNVYAVYQNDADAGNGITAGEAVYIASTNGGYFSNVGETFNTADGMGKFSWEYVVNGAADLTP